ncbi:MAG: hypothetical protein LBJ00_12860 [Planctomycetaceae bacterium]|nr:hypothetical protein [Planctomycetaceae bacterium]
MNYPNFIVRAAYLIYTLCTSNSSLSNHNCTKPSLKSQQHPTLLPTSLQYTVAGKAIGFALEQPLHVVALACPALGIFKVA